MSTIGEQPLSAQGLPSLRVIDEHEKASATEKHYLRSSDLNGIPFKIYIGNVEAKKFGLVPKEVSRPFKEDAGDLSQWDVYVTCQLFAGGIPLCLPEQTKHHELVGIVSFNEWLVLSVTLDALPVSTVVCVTVWDFSGREAVPIGGSTIPVFHGIGKMVRGRRKLFLWNNVAADPGENSNSVTSTPWNAGEVDETDNLEALVVRYEKKKFDRIPWLDALSFAEMRARREQAIRKRKDNVAFLHVHFPVFSHGVIFHQREFIIPADESQHNDIVTVFDPEIAQSNPVDYKFRRIQRYNIGLNVKTKPTNADKKFLKTIVDSPPTIKLTEEEKNKIWMFRFHLTKYIEALPKFLQSVDWTLPAHAEQAIKLMTEDWENMNMEVALELLSMDDIPNSRICSHAVQFLESIHDDELGSFLLQLVQAMRSEQSSAEKPLSDFLLRRAQKSVLLGTGFMWYLKVEAEKDDDDGAWYKMRVSEFLESIEDDQSLAYIYHRQDRMVRTLRELSKYVKESSKNRPEMIAILQRELAAGHFAQLRDFPPLPFPLNPTINVVGLVPEKCMVFKSAQKPLGLCFKREDGGDYMVLWKTGDDLRCDQLVLQIIRLMDNILKRDGNLDLKLSPYRVLATGRSDGMVEIVPDSISVASCLRNNDNDIALYLRRLHPSQSGPFGIGKEALDTFVRSCAGYCVITYLLGVGDRHLDNLLLTKKGHLFHIDFGFILGEDPKSWPPPMKITREMVVAMGGDNSEYYYQFRNLICEAYTLLRRKSNLIINLFGLMLHAGIKNGHTVIDSPDDLYKVQSKYSLDQTEEAAIETIQILIHKSVAALMPRLIEDFHSWAQYWRS